MRCPLHSVCEKRDNEECLLAIKQLVAQEILVEKKLHAFWVASKNIKYWSDVRICYTYLI